ADAIQRDADQWIERELDTIQAAIDATNRAIVERVGEDNVYLIERNISDLVRATGSLLRWSNAEDDGGRLTSALRRPLAISNFYMAALGLQACYMQRAAPISLIALREVLSSLSGPNTDGPVPPGNGWREIARPLAGDLYAAKDLRLHLTAIAEL